MADESAGNLNTFLEKVDEVGWYKDSTNLLVLCIIMYSHSGVTPMGI